MSTPTLNIIDERQKLFEKFCNSHYIDYPFSVSFETLSLCNSNCTFCSYQDSLTKGERMSDDLIDKIICDLKEIPKDIRFRINPTFLNEPFLDKRLYKIIERLEYELPNADLLLISNASPLDHKNVQKLLSRKNIQKLSLSFNSHIEEDYKRIMGLDYNKVVKNIDNIHRVKECFELEFEVRITKVSENENLDEKYKNWIKDRWPLFSIGVIDRFDWLDRSDNQGGIYQNYSCYQWFTLQILSDGTVANCCIDSFGKNSYANIKDMKLLDIYNMEDRKAMRKVDVKRKDIDTCKNCNYVG